MPPTRVLVTGAGGLVGRAVVSQLLSEGNHVLATDLDTPANRAFVETVRDGCGRGTLEEHWTDLTDSAAVGRLLTETAPDVVLHLAAVIPPQTYAAPELARRVNVEATGDLVSCLAGLPVPPRLVLASSIAVHGPRNPHTHTDMLGPDTPVAPCDSYGIHKAEAERLVRDSALDWVVLRLGGVLSADPLVSAGNPDNSHFGALLPTDGRLQTVDVRDVARAFATAVHAPVVGQTHLVGGDATHRLRQDQVAREVTGAMGLEGAVPDGLPGDPTDDGAWFATDWMDTTAAQATLDFQRISWPDLLAEVRQSIGWKRHLFRVVAPVAHEVLRRRSPYRHHTSPYADPWGAIEDRWGDPHGG